MARPPIWFIDDDTPTAQDIMEFWKSAMHLPIDFRHFSTAHEACESLLKGKETPSAIIVDGHLDSDEGDLTNGAHFIQLVRSRSDIAQPILIAFSGDDYALEEMKSAGADAEFYKGNIGDVISYLREQLTFNSPQNC